MSENQYEVTPLVCNICGASSNDSGVPFIARQALAMHKTWHTRQGEAKRLANGVVAPTAEGRRKFAEYLQSNPFVPDEPMVRQKKQRKSRTSLSNISNQNQDMIQILTETEPVVVENSAPTIPSEEVQATLPTQDVLKTISNAFLLIQVATVLHDMPTERAMQIVSTMKQLGNMTTRRR